MTAALDESCLRLALRLAQRGCGRTSPNPMVGAVLVKKGAVIGQGWHHGAGEPHAEIEALRDAQRRGHSPAGATLYVTLEPCCTQGRTPPCTIAIIAAGIRRVVAAAIDPNPAHAGRGLRLLEAAGLRVTQGVLAEPAARLNEAFNHWIVHRTPLVTVKAAMTLDGKIATTTGESKWITGPKARAWGMKLRARTDAILIGVNTILRDDPSLTVRPVAARVSRASEDASRVLGEDCPGGEDAASPARETRAATVAQPRLRRIILDSRARTPLSSRVVSDPSAELTTVVVTDAAPARRVAALAKRVSVLAMPAREGRVDLRRLLGVLGRDNVTSLLLEGGGEVNAAFLEGKLAHRIAFFYAPKIIGGRDAVKAVAGEGFAHIGEAARLREVQWRQLGPDLLLTGRIVYEHDQT